MYTTLEPLVTICAWCNKQKIIDTVIKWVSVTETVSNATHGMCPTCKQEEINKIRKGYYD